MLRILVMVLVAANLLYFGWSRWAVRDKPMLTAVASSPARLHPRATPPPPPPCAALGPFHDELLAAQAEKQLAAAGWRPRRRASSEDISDGWWVYVSNGSAAAQARTLEIIRGSGLRDAFALPDDPQFKVSVGLFSDQERAAERAARVQHLKLDAVVTEHRKQQAAIWFDLPGVAREALRDGRLDASGLPLDVLRIEDCPAAAPATAPPPAATPAEESPPPAPAGDTGKTASGAAALGAAGDSPRPRV